jgi:hypothetical protein
MGFLILTVIVNVPILAYADANCQTKYETYVSYQFPCGIFVDCGRMDGFSAEVTIASVFLYAGYSATSSTVATSKAVFAFASLGCKPTYISGLTLSGTNITLITQWDNNTGSSGAGNPIDFSSSNSANSLVHSASPISFTYYPESTTQQQISSGRVYNYVVNFADGQSVSGSLIAI